MQEIIEARLQRIENAGDKSDIPALAKALRRAVEGLEEIAGYQEFQPGMMRFRTSKGEFENFGRFCREALADIQKIMGGDGG